jgi:predicted PurR-regulated permease PerM
MPPSSSQPNAPEILQPGAPTDSAPTRGFAPGIDVREASRWGNKRILWLLALGTLIVSMIWHAPDEVRYVVGHAGELFLTLVLAMAGTYLLRPCVRALMRLPFFGTHKGGRMWATIAVFIGALLLLWLFFVVGLKPIIQDVRELWDKFMPANPDARRVAMEGWKESLRAALAPYQEILPFKVDEKMDAALAAYVGQGARFAYEKLSHSFSPGFLVELILIPVLVFYFLTDGKAIRAEARLLVPSEWHPRVRRILEDLDRVLDGYIRGQVWMCIIAWVFVTILLLALRVPYALPLGILAGVTRAVPVIGPLLGGVPLIVVTLLTTGSMNTTLTLLLAFTLMHFLESKVLLPKIVGHEVDLHPVTVIIALLVGLEFFGFLGVFLSVPIAALAKILLTEMHEKRAQVALERGDDATLRDVHDASALTR